MITGEDFLALAEVWVTGTTEAEWRSAVSRAYYAAYAMSPGSRKFFLFCPCGNLHGSFIIDREDRPRRLRWLPERPGPRWIN